MLSFKIYSHKANETKFMRVQIPYFECIRYLKINDITWLSDRKLQNPFEPMTL